MGVDERRRGSARPIRKRHHNSLPRTCFEAALGRSTFGRREVTSTRPLGFGRNGLGQETVTLSANRVLRNEERKDV
jgi:hypothetical protein